MKNNYLKSGTPESTMRLCVMIVIVTCCCVAVGGVAAVIILNRSGMLGGIAGVIGSLSTGAFLGKAAQSFAELRGNRRSRPATDDLLPEARRPEVPTPNPPAR